jgi:Holliday junction DNA helicase RuvB
MIDTPVTTSVTLPPEEEQLLTNLRAQTWVDFLGQGAVKKALQVAIEAANQRQDALDHTLLYGPPGLGKTTLAHLIAKELGVQLRITSGTALAKAGDLAAILTNLEARDVLFIDEIHRLPKAVEETLYTAMEDYALDIVLGKGPSARTVRLELQPFTLVGATTRFGVLSGPFRDRFGLTQRLQHYQAAELVHILQKAAQKLNINLADESALVIAQRSRGTPRIGLQLLKRVRDMAQVQNQNRVTPALVADAVALLAIDDLGLTDHDRRFLTTIIDQYQGGPVGLSTLAATLSEDPVTIEEVMEPYLLQIGFIQKTPKGRLLTEHAYVHLQRPVPSREKS